MNKLKPRVARSTLRALIELRRAINFGDYELLERIKIGGMAEVLKARLRSDASAAVVAVKRILPHLTSDKQYVAMFLDESRVLARLSHEGIVRTLEVGQVEETPFIALEYVFGQDGRALFNRARRSAPTPIRMTCHVVAKVCAALHYAHEATDDAGLPLGLVHRDVSLQNILISYAGEVKLTDFGIASGAHSTARTEAGVLKGNLGYTSPEQLQGDPADRRSDVFAAGVCLHELLGNHRLFGGANDYASITKLRHAVVEPPSSLNREVPPALDELVMRALAKSPDDRFQTAGAMCDALLAFMATHGHDCSPHELGAHMRATFVDALAKPGGASAVRRRQLPVDESDPPGDSQSIGDDEGDHAAAADSFPGAAPSEPTWGDRSASDVFVRTRGPADLGYAATLDTSDAAVRAVLGSGHPPASGNVNRGPLPRISSVPPPARAGSQPPSTDESRGSKPPPVRRRVQPIAYGAVVGAVAAIIAVIVVALIVQSRHWPAEIRLMILPPDAAVFVDGQRITGRVPLVIGELEPGTPHQIEVSKPGYVTWSTRLTLAPRQSLRLPPIVLIPGAAPDTTRPARR